MLLRRTACATIPVLHQLQPLGLADLGGGGEGEGGGLGLHKMGCAHMPDQQPARTSCCRRHLTSSHPPPPLQHKSIAHLGSGSEIEGGEGLGLGGGGNGGEGEGGLGLQRRRGREGAPCAVTLHR